MPYSSQHADMLLFFLFLFRGSWRQLGFRNCLACHCCSRVAVPVNMNKEFFWFVAYTTCSFPHHCRAVWIPPTRYCCCRRAHSHFCQAEREEIFPGFDYYNLLVPQNLASLGAGDMNRPDCVIFCHKRLLLCSHNILGQIFENCWINFFFGFMLGDVFIYRGQISYCRNALRTLQKWLGNQYSNSNSYILKWKAYWFYRIYPQISMRRIWDFFSWFMQFYGNLNASLEQFTQE